MNKIILAVVDTETAGGFKYPFIYNLAYTIEELDLDTAEVKTIVERDFVIKQIWQNRELMQTAYYERKRPLYTSMLKGRKAKAVNYGVAISTFKKDLEKAHAESVWAFNGSFDNRAIHFNNEWYKKPKDYFPYELQDIRPLISKLVDAKEYETFCRENGFITEKEHINTTAESFYAYAFSNPNHIEKHLALSDAREEMALLEWCYLNNKCRAIF